MGWAAFATLAAWTLFSFVVFAKSEQSIRHSENRVADLKAQRKADAELIAELLDPALFDHHRPRQVTVVEHHLAHAASAFHPSGFDEAAVLVVDGSGDGVSATLAHGTADGLKVLRQFPFSHSLGRFYGSPAVHLGLGNWTTSGKLMGLAGYGNPDRYTLDFLTARAGGSSRRS